MELSIGVVKLALLVLPPGAARTSARRIVESRGEVRLEVGRALGHDLALARTGAVGRALAVAGVERVEGLQGSGRITASETEAPNTFGDPV